MRISPIGTIGSMSPITSVKPASAEGVSGEGTGEVSFGSSMKKALGQVNELQKNADDMAVKLATGDVEDVHKAMLAMQKAKLAFDFTVQVRNKVIEAYQEIMRMQV